MSYIYVGSPYSGTPEQMNHRYRQVLHYTQSLLVRRVWCYSPIVHCHEMAKVYKLPTDAIFWMEYNFAMMKGAHEFHILQLDGWKESLGLKTEIAFWRSINKEEEPIMIGGPR